MAAPATSRRALSGVLLLAGVFCLGLVLTVLFVYGGWDYYRAPVGTRGYLAAHKLLRPSGAIGLALGVAGAIAMLSTLPYAARKHLRPLSRLGAMPRWLEVHIFFGIIGPVMVTMHTSFKFNGIISVGYWLMMTVWASGFVGRYLYVRIPKTIRGVELSRADVEADLARARSSVEEAPLPAVARAALDEFDRAVAPGHEGPPGAVDLFFGELRVRLRLLMMRRQLRRGGVDIDAIHTAVTQASQHAALARRLAHLERTRRLFALWHVFHRPLVYVMFLIVGLHVGIAAYLGYARMLSEMLP